MLSNLKRAIKTSSWGEALLALKGSLQTFSRGTLSAELRFRTAGAPDGWPLPPPRLIYRIIGHGWGSRYFDSGKAIVDDMLQQLAAAGVDCGRIRRVLDFGCGSGRLIRHMSRALRNAELSGVDYNASLVHWCDKHLDGMHFSLNELMPPLDFPDRHFDLVYARSVFTHLDETAQRAWLDEMSRVLTADGVLVMTTHGEQFLGRLTPAQRRAVADGELVTLGSSPQGTNYLGSFQSRGHVERLAAARFALLAHAPGRDQDDLRQDIFILQSLPVPDGGGAFLRV